MLVRAASFLLITCLLIPAMASADEATPYSRLIEPTPSELHQFLADGKNKAFVRAKQIEASMPSPAMLGQNDYDVKYYKINALIDEVSAEIFGRVTIIGRSYVNNLSSVTFNFFSNMDIDTVLENGLQTANYTHTNNLLTVGLAIPIDADEEFEIVVRYNGTPTKYAGEGLAFTNHAGTPVVYSSGEPYGAQTWWPCKDLPCDKADSVDIIIECNSAYRVTSNGVLRDSTDNGGGTTTYWWHEGYPIPPYLVTIAFTNYMHYRDWYTYGPADLDSMPVDFYPYPELYDAAVAGWTETVPQIEFFYTIFNQYPFVEEKYGHTHWNWPGAMEHSTNTSVYNDNWGFGEYLVGHELAHQWFGDYITPASWHHIWLNEGFASYAEALWSEHQYGETNYHNYMRSMQYWYWGTIYITDTTAYGDVLSTRVYDKGAWVLHMLRGIVGDADFFQIFDDYTNDPRWAYGMATTEDFQEICETVSGLDLNGFFQAWIYDMYYPIYQTGYGQNPEDYSTSAYITQIQKTRGFRDVFAMPAIDLLFKFTDDSDTLITVDASLEDQSWTFAFDKPLDTMIFDPDNWVLDSVYYAFGPTFVRESFLFDDSGGNNNNRADPGENNIPLLFDYVNIGTDAIDLELTVSTEHPQIVFSDAYSSYGDVLHGQAVSNASDPAIFSVDPDFPPQTVAFVLTFTADGGAFTVVDTIKADVGPPQLLLVDDDNVHHYEDYFTVELEDQLVSYTVWGRDTLAAPNPDTIAAYQMVFWFGGDSQSDILTTADVDALRDVLDNGGRLFISGQDIAQDLSDDADSTFLIDYLHIRFDPTNPVIFADGVEGDPIGDGEELSLGGPGGESNQTSPDVLVPIDGLARPTHTYYNSSDAAGIRIADGDYRAVMFGFGMEGIADDLGYTTRADVFARVIAWLKSDSPDYVPGDLTGEGTVNPVDVVHLVNFVYKNIPLPWLTNPADVNTDCTINPVDVVLLVNYVYKAIGTLSPGCVE